MNTVIQIWIEHPDRPSADLLRYMSSIRNNSTAERQYNLISIRDYFSEEDPNEYYEWVDINSVVSDFLNAYPGYSDDFGRLLPQHKSDILRMFIMSNMPHLIYIDCDVEIYNAALNGLCGNLDLHGIMLSANARSKTSVDSCISGRNAIGDMFFTDVLNRMLDAIRGRKPVFYDTMFKAINQAVEEFKPSFFRVPANMFIHHHGA